MSDKTKGILWMLYACFGAALMMVFIKILSHHIDVFQIVFFRNFVALILFLPWIIRHGNTWYDLSHVKTSQFKMYLSRGVIGFIAMNFYFYSLTIVPLTVATSLSFISPIITAIYAMFFFGEKYGIHRWSALIIGFLGVLVILRPGADEFDLNALFVIAAASMWSLSGIIIKVISKNDDPVKIVFYMALLMTPLSIPLAYINWQPIPLESIPYIIGLGFVSFIFQIALSRAISITEFAVILPYDFSRLIYIIIFSYFFFDEIIDFQTVFGASIIMGSAVYSSYREKLKKTKKCIEKK